MRTGRASKTAEHNALFRALEARRPPADRVCDDRLAVAFLSWPTFLVAQAARIDAVRDRVVRFIDGRWPGVRPTVVARTRLIDDTLAAKAGDAAQVVVLGAGFDTRAHRLACLADVPVFEVDHPDTQVRKRKILDRRHITRPRMHYVPIDFSDGELGAALAASGWSPDVPTLILWEGVTNYLSEPEVDATLRWCAKAPAGSRLIVTYVDRALFTDPGRYAGSEQLRSTLRRAGEEMTFGLDPDEAPAYLAERGLTLRWDVGAREFRQRYYGDAARSMSGHDFYRVAYARVGGG
ncbi:MAG TPA: SAM-dependent methyltransferase [Acidimicrobiales bacterium]